MICREAFIKIAHQEQDRTLSEFLQTDEGSEVESHISNCRCNLCQRSQARICSAGVRGSLRVIEGGKTANG